MKIQLFFLMVSICFACSHSIEPPTAPEPLGPGRIVISEVLYNPAGNNAGMQLVELKNVGGDPVEMNGWWFCARQDYAQLPNVCLLPGAVLVVHIGASGNDTADEAFLPTMLPLQNISDLNLYRNAGFTNPQSMAHFVQWGGVSPIGRQSEAVSAGLWVQGEFTPGVADGHSVEYDGEGFSASDWRDQPAPNIGF